MTMRRLPNHWAVDKRTFEGLIDHYWKVTIRTTGRSTGSLIGRYKTRTTDSAIEGFINHLEVDTRTMRA